MPCLLLDPVIMLIGITFLRQNSAATVWQLMSWLRAARPTARSQRQRRSHRHVNSDRQLADLNPTVTHSRDRMITCARDD